jgi:hypothetical protein
MTLLFLEFSRPLLLETHPVSNSLQIFPIPQHIPLDGVRQRCLNAVLTFVVVNELSCFRRRNDWYIWYRLLPTVSRHGVMQCLVKRN